ncbi:ornithine carbamoyltransferase [Trueperella bialowiezensis]|uniref:Ornithine carbamoyltransferase n=1 Tax=Trueperella bialowiezensis TaxID=312285 RepID=A0A3S4V890_9ACTO|nr:ornithine carbamoyltransferase [Trueperella bialowiezensis]VEI14143.1 Ornithine carbamoyltransferase chain F [Trueperella bialowiezensis]
MHELYGRSFLKEADFTPAQWQGLIELAAKLKADRKAGREVRYLDGKTIALLFEKTSTRTRTAFEVAAFHQGAHVTMLDGTTSQIGHKESYADTAAVLGRFYDAIQFRGSEHEGVEILARHAGVPVYNGLTDSWHPTQMLADALTIKEHVAKPFSDVVHAYLGDARFNTGRSLLVSSAMLGMDVRIIAPREYQPDAEARQIASDVAAQTGARITITEDPAAVAGADVVSTDVWVSMGEAPDVWADRVAALRPYQVNAELMSATDGAIFMHCLPAFHDLNTSVGREVYEATGMDALEVTDDVFSSPASKVFDQAENRMHTIKAVMVATLAENL